MSIERRNISSTKVMETPGFIIFGSDDTNGVTADQEPKQPSVPTIPPRPVSDEIRAASSRIEYRTHVLEPEIKDGEKTGKWRVRIFRRKRRLDDHILPLKLNWDRQFESREAADAWVSSVLESIGNRKS